MDDTSTLPAKIISGGQTGVDRAALDVAIYLGIEHGGWCPKGRLAEDGRVPPQYDLQELSSRKYWVRTERNVVDSDATLILYCDELTGGTEFTYRMTQKHARPCLKVDLANPPAESVVRSWLEHTVTGNVLNVAGPRESSLVGIHERAREYLLETFGDGCRDYRESL
jgi:hypothetical protein